MTIAVFNYNNDSVDIIHADKAYIDDMYSGDVERYLYEDLNYDPDDIAFMSNFKSIEFIDSDRLNQIS